MAGTGKQTTIQPRPGAVERGASSQDPFPGESERRRKQLVERSILGATLFFCIALVVAIWVSEGTVLNKPVRFLQRIAGVEPLASRDAALNCRLPKNRNTPYCQERIAKTDSDWNSMNRAHDGKTSQFTLHSN